MVDAISFLFVCPFMFRFMRLIRVVLLLLRRFCNISGCV